MMTMAREQRDLELSRKRGARVFDQIELENPQLTARPARSPPPAIHLFCRGWENKNAISPF
jgi:hypothetical protein